MDLELVGLESTFSYFEALERYLTLRGRVVAYHSDKHGVFRVPKQGASTGCGMTQFGRALTAGTRNRSRLLPPASCPSPASRTRHRLPYVGSFRYLHDANAVAGRQSKPVEHDKRRYKRRNRIEIIFGHLNNWRCVATCYDRCPGTFLSAVVLTVTVPFRL